MRISVFWQTINWVSLPLLAVLTALLLRQRAQRQLPLFFSYIVTGFLVDAVRLLAYLGSSVTYFYAYWISGSVSTVFALFATGELVLKRLFPQFHRVRFYRYLFSIAAVILVCFTLLIAFLSKSPWLLSIFIRSLQTFDFLRVAVLIFFVGLMLFMGRRWERYEFGIALGLGINAAVLLVSIAGPTHLQPTVLNYLPVLGYDTACLAWVISFLKPEKSLAGSAGPISPAVLHEARKWEETLKGSLTGKKPNSDS